jgi:hypothetical protein
VRAAVGGYVAVHHIEHNPGLADGSDVARDALAAIVDICHGSRSWSWM